MKKKLPLNRVKIVSRVPKDIVAATDYEDGDICLLTCADIHLMNDCSYGKFDINGVNSDLIDKFNAMKEATCIASITGSPFIFSGDLLDQRCVDGVTSSFCSEAISYVQHSTAIPDHLWLGGNHEFDDSAAMFSTLKHYRYFVGSLNNKKRGHIITDIQKIEITVKEKKILFHCFPAHQQIEKQLKDSFESIRKGLKKSDATYHVMLVHGGIEGADIGNLKFKGGIDSKIIQQYSEIFDWIICGDFHKFQFINGLKNAYYCGSIKQMNLGDSGQSRGYQLLNLTKGTVNFIPSRCPVFKVLEIVPGEYCHPWIKKPEKYSEKLKNKIFDIKITGDSETVNKVDFEKIRNDMMKYGAFNVYKNPNVISEKRNSTKIDKDNSKIDIITKYVENKFYDTEKIKVKRYISVLSKYAKE